MGSAGKFQIGLNYAAVLTIRDIERADFPPDVSGSKIAASGVDSEKVG